MVEFQKAERTQNFLRMFIDGPAGSGKTYTALRLAFNLGKTVCVIDTQNGASKLYAGDVDADGNQFNFLIVELNFFSAENFIEAIRAAEGIGADVIIIDSLSHAWDGTGGTLEFVNTYPKDATLQAWNEATKNQRKLINAMNGVKAHVIVTMRTKTRLNLKRKTREEPTKYQKRIQKEGIEYEFDLGLTMSSKNIATVVKTHSRRFPMFETYEKPGKPLAEKILQWLRTSDRAPHEEPKPQPILAHPPQAEQPEPTEVQPEPPAAEAYTEEKLAKLRGQIRGALEGLVITRDQYNEWRTSKYIPSDRQLTGEELELLLSDIDHKMKTGRWEPTPF